MFRMYLSIFILLCLMAFVVNGYENKNKDNHSIHLVSERQKADSGKALYTKYCMSCHQADGSGVPGMYPPLNKSNWVNGDKKRLITILLNGLNGEIEVNNETYNQAMPLQNFLTDKQIAELLTYIRKNFDNKANPVKINEVTKLRKSKSH